MAANDASTRARVERTGLNMIDVQSGLGAMENILSSINASGIIACVPFSWNRFLGNQFKDGKVPAMFSSYQSYSNVSKEKMHTPKEKTRQRSNVGAKSATVSEESLLEQVQAAICAVLGSDVQANEPLMSAGLDSLSAVEFRNDLESKLGVDLPGTLVFDYPTPASIAGFLTTVIVGGKEETEESTELEAQLVDQSTSSAIAITKACIRASRDSFHGIYPVDASTLIPLSRWDIDSHADLFSGTPVRFAPVLENIDLFDPGSLGLSDAEASLMDPQHRILLEMAAEILFWRGKSFKVLDRNTGVFVGLSSTDYAKVIFFLRL
jgi:acyl carrier protein